VWLRNVKAKLNYLIIPKNYVDKKTKLGFLPLFPLPQAIITPNTTETTL
jgi:hypothetical protein